MATRYPREQTTNDACEQNVSRVRENLGAGGEGQQHVGGRSAAATFVPMTSPPPKKKIHAKLGGTVSGK